MATMFTHHPKRAKNCVFCNYWIGNAEMEFVNSAVGYRYNSTARGKCTKRNGASTTSCYTCKDYDPSMDAKKLL